MKFEVASRPSLPVPPDNPIDLALRAVPPERRFVVAYANPDKPQLVITLHSKDDGAGESYVTRTITLEDEGLVIFDSRNSFKDVVFPRSADGIGDQVRALVHSFADELSIADGNVFFGGRRGDKATTTDALELPAVWSDPERIARAQAAFKNRERRPISSP